MLADSEVWAIPEVDTRLDGDSVHVWRIAIPELPSRVLSSAPVLSRLEQEKACRFYFEQDRHKYLTIHAAVRQILSGYLNQPPAKIEYAYTDYGKPYLAGNGDQALHFNLSHSGWIALLGITMDREIGIDIEQMRVESVDPRVARRFFAPNESSALFAMPESERVKAFFNCWTRKEAFVKGVGEGLSYPLDQFEISVDANGSNNPIIHLKTYRNPLDADQWRIQHLAPGDGYTGALAVRGRAWTLKCWQWKFPS